MTTPRKIARQPRTTAKTITLKPQFVDATHLPPPRSSGFLGTVAVAIITIGFAAAAVIMEHRVDVAMYNQEVQMYNDAMDANNLTESMQLGVLRLCIKQHDLWKIVADKDTLVASVDAQAAQKLKEQRPLTEIDTLLGKGIERERVAAEDVTKKLKDLCKYGR